MDLVRDHAAVVVIGSNPPGLAVALGLARQGLGCVLMSDGAEADRDGARSDRPRRGVDETARLSTEVLSLLSGLGVDTAGFTGRTELCRTYLDDREVDSRPLADPPPYVNVSLDALTTAMLAAVAAGGHSVVATSAPPAVVVDSAGVTATAWSPAGEPLARRADYAVVTSARPGGVAAERADDSRADPTLVLVDVEAEPGTGTERRLSIEPPWHPRGYALLEPTTPGCWRVEWPTPASATSPEAVATIVPAVLGAGVSYAVRAVRRCPAGWHLPQTYRSGRVFFAGDATQALPAVLDTAVLDTAVLGAGDVGRGIQDAANLAWKLAYVISGNAGDELLESYELERRPAVEAQVEELAEALRSLSPTTRSTRWRRHGIGVSRRSARLRRIEDAWASDPGTYSSPVLQPGAGALAPELPVRATDGWRGPLSDLRGGAITVVAIGPTETDAVTLAVAVEAAALARAASTGDPSLPPHRFAGGAAANATAGLDAAGTALGNLLVVRPDGRISWKVNGEDAPDEVAVALAAALSRTVGR